MKINEIRSLGRRTDLIFAQFAGEVLEKENYIAIKTPSNPGYHWGNYLLFKDSPQHDDLDRWQSIYKKEFTYYPQIRHMTFTWDSTKEGQPDEFIKAGFRFEKAKVLTAQKVIRPTKFNSDIIVRPLLTKDEWEAATHLQVFSRDLSFNAEKYLSFKRQQMTMYRKMTEKGMGYWFGAYLDSKLVGDLGIYFEQSIGRFQNVETHPDYRRLGICGALVYQSAQYMFEKFAIKTLVMEADADYHAARIYESVGFCPTEENYSLSWWES